MVLYTLQHLSSLNKIFNPIRNSGDVFFFLTENFSEELNQPTPVYETCNVPAAWITFFILVFQSFFRHKVTVFSETGCGNLSRHTLSDTIKGERNVTVEKPLYHFTFFFIAAFLFIQHAVLKHHHKLQRLDTYFSWSSITVSISPVFTALIFYYSTVKAGL